MQIPYATLLCSLLRIRVKEALRQRGIAEEGVAGWTGTGLPWQPRQVMAPWPRAGPPRSAWDTWLLACRKVVSLLGTSSLWQNSHMLHRTQKGSLRFCVITVIPTDCYYRRSFLVGTKWEASYNHRSLGQQEELGTWFKWLMNFLLVFPPATDRGPSSWWVRTSLPFGSANWRLPDMSALTPSFYVVM